MQDGIPYRPIKVCANSDDNAANTIDSTQRDRFTIICFVADITHIEDDAATSIRALLTPIAHLGKSFNIGPFLQLQVGWMPQLMETATDDGTLNRTYVGFS